MRVIRVGKASGIVIGLIVGMAFASLEASAQGDGLTGTYYQWPSGTASPPPPPPGSPEAGAATWTPTVTRIDPTVNFANVGGAPWAPAGVGPNFFTVAWTGYVLTGADSGAYSFSMVTDDGSRLWVTAPMTAGGELPNCNKWFDQGATTYTGSVNLLPNTFYPIRYEFYQNGGNTAAQLEWSSATMAVAAIPQTNLYSAANPKVCLVPTNLTATGGFNQAVLTWTAGAGATSYVVLRGTTAGGPYTQIAAGVVGTTYTDTTATFPGPYYYVVYGVNADGNSPYSNEANCTTKQPTVSVAPGSLQVAENGGTATFTVTLLDNPTANVTVQCSSANAAALLLTAPGGTPQGTIQLTFTAGGALTQQVTVTGVEQHLEGAPVTVNVTFTVTSTDANYPPNCAPPPLPVTIIEDLPGIIINPPSGLSTVNGGPPITFTVQLATVPNGTVVLNLSVTDPTLATVSPLQITNAAWNNPVTVTVTPTNVNTQTTYIAPYDIVVDASASTDPAYAAMGQTLVPIGTPVNLPPLTKVWGSKKCGLLGIETLLPLLIAGWWRRRRRSS